MIKKIRRFIGMTLGAALTVLSLGMLKPNTSGDPAIDETIGGGDAAVGLELDDEEDAATNGAGGSGASASRTK